METENISRVLLGDIKRIASRVGESYRLDNRGTWFQITEKKTNQSFNPTQHQSNFIYNKFIREIEKLYLLSIRQDYTYFDRSKHGIKVAHERNAYLSKVELKVVEILCGWTPPR